MGKRLIDMTPGERRNAVNRALRALEAELHANRERIEEILAMEDADPREVDG